MGAIESVMKSEIVRLAKKEARRLTRPLREDFRKLKQRNAEFKNYVAKLEGRIQQFEAKARLAEATSKAADGKVEGRLSPRLIKSLRKKLGLSQNEFAKILSVSIGSVVNWESGKMSPRPEMRAKMLSFRGMNKREAKSILANLFQAPVNKPAARPRKKSGKAKSVRATIIRKGRGKK